MLRVYRDTREIRIAIISEHRVFGESLACALDGQPEFEVRVVALEPNDAALCTNAITVVIIDLEGLDMVIEAAVPRLRESTPHAGIIVLSSRTNPETLHRSIDSGADGHVSKEKGLQELGRAITCVADGITYLDPSDRRSAESAVPAIVRLSAREREVLGLLAQGFTNRDIAHTLNVAEKTAKNHVSNILSKLQTKSRTQAVIHAQRRGIV